MMNNPSGKSGAATLAKNARYDIGSPGGAAASSSNSPLPSSSFFLNPILPARSIYRPPSALLTVKKIRNMHVTMEISSAAPSTLMEGGGMDECGDGWEEDCLVLIVFWGEDGVGL
jgi:hypothetical protein